jgi:hypothetical protein
VDRWQSSRPAVRPRSEPCNIRSSSRSAFWPPMRASPSAANTRTYVPSKLARESHRIENSTFLMLAGNLLTRSLRGRAERSRSEASRRQALTSSCRPSWSRWR